MKTFIALALVALSLAATSARADRPFGSSNFGPQATQGY